MSDTVEKQDRTKYPFYPIVMGWLEKIRLGKDFKKHLFQDDADTAMKFFHCGRDLDELLYRRHELSKRLPTEDEEDLPSPRFRMCVGKVAEIVQLFGPSLYHRNPKVLVNPKDLEIPIELQIALVPPQVMQQHQMQAQQQAQMAQQQGQPPPPPFDPASLFPPDPQDAVDKMVAHLLEYYLDYIQMENGKKDHSRRMIDEALIKGMGVLWTEQYESFPGGPNMIGSFYDTIDHIILDPDADNIADVKWIARECVHPIQEVAKDYGIKESWLKEKFGTDESLYSQGESVANSNVDKDRKMGKTCDLLTYYKVYSKIGMGHKLAGIENLEDFEEYLDGLGDNCYIVVAKDIPFPLNMKTKDFVDLMNEDDEDKAASMYDDITESTSWPIPFWANGEWPCTFLAFHEVPNSPWPISHIKPALGYLKFLNWCMSFLVNKIRTSCATVAACMKSAEEEIKTQLFSGKDFRVIEVPMSLAKDGDINKAVHFLEMPPFSGDIWKVLEAVFDLFDKATGLTELMYSQPGGMRSAEEAKAKQANMNIRPDDMGNKVEDCMSAIARKEAFAARYLLDGKAVEPILGRKYAKAWEQYVMSGDLLKVSHDFHYRIEAGSMRKPNVETEQDNVMKTIQAFAPLIQHSLETGNVKTVNAFLEHYGKAFDFDMTDFLLPQPQPQPNPMEQKIQGELQIKQQELQMKQQESQQEIQREQQKAQAELQFEQAKGQQELALEQARMEMEKQKMQLEMQMEQQKMQMEMAMQKAKLAMEMKVADVRAKAEAAKSQQQMALEGQRVGFEMQRDQALAENEVKAGQVSMLGDMAQQRQKLAMQKEAHAQSLALEKKKASQKPKGKAE